MEEPSALIGHRIGASEVLSLLGSGGMGDVYRAHDARLDRDVALKVVRPSLAADPELMVRLEREARVLATLSHPHIAAIYQIEDIPEHTGVGPGARALVLELVNGETLADRLSRAFATARGGLPVAEAIGIAAQIVSALDSAHERGIVHRDLKPANVKLTEDQVVKVLDFGLAKAVSSADAAHSPTITSASRDGMLLGTPAYMSPEQVRGKPVDKRTDIWAFGCVLYELLTGQPVFARATIADTIASILGDEPDWAMLPDATPRTYSLRRIGADGSGDRQVTFGDMSHVAPDVHSSGMLVACRIRSTSDIWKFPVTASPADNVHAGVRITHQTGQVQTPSVSPDGLDVVFLSDNGAHANLWIARTDGSGIRQLTFERDRSVTIGVPLWSPAGDRIAFVCSRQTTGIRVIHPSGRGLRQLVPDGFGPCWSRDGKWLYYTRTVGPRWRIEKVPLDGGDPVLVRDDGYVHSPVVGESVLFFAVRSWHLGSVDWTICRATSDDGPAEPIGRISAARVPVTSAFVHGNLSPDGDWLALPLIDGGTTNVWALPTTGGPMRPLTDFQGRSTLIARQVWWSPDGQFVYAAVAELGADVVMYDGLLSP